MKLTLTRNIGSDDLRAFGVLTGGDPVEFRKALDTYSKGSTVDAPENFGEYLLKRGLATVEVKGVAAQPAMHGAPADVSVTAEAKKRG